MVIEHNAAPKLDKVDGQHWTTVQALWAKKDRDQCESWKDEVQNVLIFSGLFSAIVTAFITVSQQNLNPDPIVVLLQQIATHITPGYSIAPDDEPSTTNIDICVNVFWFLSLVLSLTAALIGIVSLQWIRTHMNILGNESEPESLGLSYLHSLGLQESYIPLIFTSLPVILILGLVLFLVGLLLYLIQLSPVIVGPVGIGIGLILIFVLTTTLHPGLQRLPMSRPSNRFPSPYRSPQSLLALQFVTLMNTRLQLKNYSVKTLGCSDGRTDWTSRSRIWLQKRQKDFGFAEERLGHSERKNLFAYDTIEALLSVKESQLAESKKERTALAKCLAEVLPLHLDFFPTGDLKELFGFLSVSEFVDFIPILPVSEFVPSVLFLQNESVTREDLSAVALLQIASCNGQLSQNPAVTEACVRTTRWLFERPRTFESVPDNQPLHLISQLDNPSLHVHEVLIATLTHFFTFAADYWPENQTINKTTHTSSYTYWFLVLSAQILTESSLSKEMQARHTYLLAVIATRLSDESEEKERKKLDYLFFTASIYASIISRSQAMRSSPFGGDFLRAVTRYHDTLEDDSTRQQLRRAVKANEVSWGDINRAVEAVGPSQPFQDDLEIAFGRESG